MALVTKSGGGWNVSRDQVLGVSGSVTIPGVPGMKIMVFGVQGHMRGGAASNDIRVNYQAAASAEDATNSNSFGGTIRNISSGGFIAGYGAVPLWIGGTGQQVDVIFSTTAADSTQVDVMVVWRLVATRG